MFIVSYVSRTHDLYVGQQFLRDTLSEAVDIGVKMAIANNINCNNVREELQSSDCCLDESGEFGIFIRQSED